MSSVKDSRLNIADCLLRGAVRWYQHYLKLPKGVAKDNSLILSKWDKDELQKNFIYEGVYIMNKNKSMKKQ
jgi:hypothetical protein